MPKGLAQSSRKLRVRIGPQPAGAAYGSGNVETLSTLFPPVQNHWNEHMVNEMVCQGLFSQGRGIVSGNSIETALIRLSAPSPIRKGEREKAEKGREFFMRSTLRGHFTSSAFSRALAWEKVPTGG